MAALCNNCAKGKLQFGTNTKQGLGYQTGACAILDSRTGAAMPYRVHTDSTNSSTQDST